MKRSVVSILAIFAVIGGGGASAQEGDLEERIRALEAMVGELKAELEAERTSDVEVVQQTAPQDQSPLAATPPSGPAIGLGDTTIRVGGFIDTDLNVTNTTDGAIGSSSIARDFYIPGATPVGGDDQTVTDLTAEATRLFVSADRKMGDTTLKGYVELDFLGSFQGNERVSNSFSPRLRRAFLSYRGFLAGQEWTTFQNTSAIPESASFLVLADGMVFIRQAMLRYTYGPFQFALENADTTVTDVTGARIEADSNAIPDAVVRYDWNGDLGNVSVAAIGRQLRVDLPGMDEDTYGFGGSVSGKLNLGGRDDFRFNVVGGEGIGRYVGLNAVNGAAVNPLTMDIEAIPVYGGYAAWRHPFGETARLNIGYSGLFADQPGFAPDTSTKSVQSVYAAVLWDVAEKITLGVEALYGRRETEGGDEGEIIRTTFSTKYAF